MGDKVSSHDLAGDVGAAVTALSVAGIVSRESATTLDRSILRALASYVDGSELLRALTDSADMLRSAAENIDAAIVLLGLECDPGPGMDA